MATRIIQDQLDMSAQTVLKTDHPAPDSLGFCVQISQWPGVMVIKYRHCRMDFT